MGAARAPPGAGAGRAAAWRAAVALWAAACLVASQELTIGSIHGSAARALELSAMMEVALRHEESLSLKFLRAQVEPYEPLSLLRGLCSLAEDGASGAVFGGGGREARSAAAAAARAGLPLLLVEPAPYARDWLALALYPHPDVLAQVAVALMREKGWTSAVLLHERTLPGAALPLLDRDDSEPTAPYLTSRRLPLSRDRALLRNLLLVLKKSGATKFVVWCSHDCIERVLAAAQRVGLLADRHSYLLLDFELHTVPLANFSYGGANVTGLRLFDPEELTQIGDSWYERYTSRLGEAEAATRAAEIGAALPASLVLAYDGARLMARAWLELELPVSPPGNCATPKAQLHAETLINHMRTMRTESGPEGSSSGPLRLDDDGARRDVRLDVVELTRGGRLRRVAVWGGGRLEWRRPEAPAAAPSTDSMTNRTFNVLIALNEPYVMRRLSTERLSGNDRYEGFCIELIERLADALHFNYTFILEDGKGYDIMMEKLIKDPDIHFAITDLTITAEREKLVDFTTPFMNLGISILFKRPELPEPKLFAFLLPFSNGVWMCLGLSYVGTSLLLYVVGRLCPQEWQNPYPCVEEPVALENQFSLVNAFWFNLGAMLQQGSEIAPVAYGTRAVASVWFVFALVITSSYTANLTTLLAKKSTTELIHNVEELAYNPHHITYGAKLDGSTYTFFEHSQNPLYQTMFAHMKQHEMPSSNKEGVAKVMNENFAFLMESTTIEHLTQRNCAVTQVGNLLDNKGYGLAMKKNSTYRQALNLALLNLQESGVLREMKHQWWNEKHGGGFCNANEDNESEELTMNNFLGLFLVLIVGSVLGMLLSFLDLVYHALRRARDRQVRFGEQLWAELRFVFRFGRSEKPLQLSLPPSPERSALSERSARESASEERPARESARPSLRSARRRSTQHTIHNASVRLARHASRRASSPKPPSLITHAR